MRYQTLTRALLIPVVGALTMTACANSDSNNTASGNDCVTGADIAAVVPPKVFVASRKPA